MPSTPRRLLLLRPDAYGDLFLFEPVPRILRHTWPETEIAVLIRQPYEDAVPLFASDGIRWLTTTCDSYREGPGDKPAALEALRDTVRAFAPDCVVAACAAQTWLESAVAAFLPAARQVSLGPGLTDPLIRAALDAVLPIDWTAVYPEKVPVGPDLPEWEQNLRLAGALIGCEAPRWWPAVQVPAPAHVQAARIVAQAGLSPGEFLVCAAAGTANVQIKSWPVESYGETLAWLEKGRGLRALLTGHVSEREHLEAVQRSARRHGADPALWLGRDGEMPVMAGLLEAGRLYFGNDTGALHLAAALSRPVVPVFGGGHWPRFKPVAARARTVVQPLPCFGCAWDCFFVDAPCVQTIATASVRRALEEILDDPAERSIVLEADGLDAGARELIDTATPHLRFLKADSADRLRQATELSRHAGELSARLQSSDADRDARQRQVAELTALLRESETDRDARQRQVEELTALLRASETDRDARQRQVEELTALLRTSDADRDARQRQVEELTALLAASETDRDARWRQVEELTALLRTSDADRDARQRQVEELTALLTASETDRDARWQQVEELTALLRTSDADRDARQGQIAELAGLLKASNADRDAHQLQIEQLTTRLKASDADREARLGQIEQFTAWLLVSEADRAARLHQIETLTALLPSGDDGRESHPATSPEAADSMHGEAALECVPTRSHAYDQTDAAHF